MYIHTHTYRLYVSRAYMYVCIHINPVQNFDEIFLFQYVNN